MAGGAGGAGGGGSWAGENFIGQGVNALGSGINQFAQGIGDFSGITADNPAGWGLATDYGRQLGGQLSDYLSSYLGGGAQAAGGGYGGSARSYGAPSYMSPQPEAGGAGGGGYWGPQISQSQYEDIQRGNQGPQAQVFQALGIPYDETTDLPAQGSITPDQGAGGGYGGGYGGDFNSEFDQAEM
jgi:hypothetical protein